MTRLDAPPVTRAVVVRGIGFGLAIALGAVAVYLIVTGSTSPRRIEIGVLAGLWGLLLGAYTMFGARRQHVESTVFAAHSELARRSSGGVESISQAEARRAFEERLEHLLRTEISNSVNREIGDLRREVAQLRHELLEKVGGQLRLERIETTRLFGSDLEALQHEVQQLKTARESFVGARPALDAAAETPAADGERTTREKAASEQAAREQAAREQAAREQAAREQAARENAASEQAAREKAATEKAAAERAAREQAAREEAARKKAAAEHAARERVAREHAAAEQARQRADDERAVREQAAREQAARGQARKPVAATNGASADPFASLPRITPFTDFELDPIEPPTVVPSAPSNGHDESEANGYTGRRRAGSDDDDAGRHAVERAIDTSAGRALDLSRHAADADDAGDRGGRRRRGDDEPNGLDLLSQLLSRESAER